MALDTTTLRAEFARVCGERDRLRAELLAIRRLVLPHPDAAADPGCGCDMVTEVVAVEMMVRELAALLAAGGSVQGHTPRGAGGEG